MSITSKIRERSGLAVAIVALGLIFFLVGGDILGPDSVIMSSFRQKIGEIDGEKVTATDFQEQIQKTEYDFQIQNNRAPSAEENTGLRDQAWNQIFFDRVNRDEFDKLGIGVPDNEKVDMVQGKNIHPSIRQAFTNPQTGEFDKNQITNFLKNINKAQPEQQAAWMNFEKKLPEDRLRTKYEALLTKTNYVTRLEAMHEYEAANSKADAQYVFVNYSTIPDSTVKVDDAELEAFRKDNANRYKVQDNRSVEFVQWVIKPNAEDSSSFSKELEEIRTDFATAQNDTQFAASASDAPAKLQTLAADQLPAELAPQIASLQAGQVYGPFASNNALTLYKVVSVGAQGDASIKASHILFTPKDKTSDTSKAFAKAKATEVLNQIKGGAPFELMAKIHGSDGTKDRGGDLGWFTRDKMVKPFADAVFAHEGAGLLPNLVETDFGYHIVKVTAPKTNVKYQVVMIQKNITAGDKARENLYSKAIEFKGNVSDPASFDGQVTKDNLKKEVAASIFKNGNGVNDISDAREIVRWAYSDDAKLGEVSKVFELTDRYVVAVLTKITEEGPATVADVREALTTEVRKKKKTEMITSKLGTGTLEQMQQKYGKDAILNTQNDLFLNTNGVGDFGYDPVVVGTIFGMKVNTTGKPLQAESGVAVIKLIKKTDAPKVDKGFDVSSYKTQIEQKNQGRVQYFIAEALKEITNTTDNRVRYF